MASAATRTLIMSPARVERTLRRLAYEVVERNRGVGTLTLFGILASGQPLAEALAREMGRVEDAPLRAHPLDATPFRDDHEAAAPSRPDDPPVDVTGRDVILIDDVLFTGRTARAALDAVIHFGRPRSIQLLALIDRGHREYPIQPDYTGRLLQTKHRERVVVEDTAEGLAVYVED
jgi:pyrimidine operon attenuation protein/uracil phosphoribosyltransferase